MARQSEVTERGQTRMQKETRRREKRVTRLLQPPIVSQCRHLPGTGSVFSSLLSESGDRNAKTSRQTKYVTSAVALPTPRRWRQKLRQKKKVLPNPQHESTFFLVWYILSYNLSPHAGCPRNVPKRFLRRRPTLATLLHPPPPRTPLLPPSTHTTSKPTHLQGVRKGQKLEEIKVRNILNENIKQKR